MLITCKLQLLSDQENLHLGCVYGGQEGTQAWIQGLALPFAALCGLLLSQGWPTQSWLWEDWHLSILCPYEILLQTKKKKKKSTNQNWIIGQAREEGRDWFLSDRLPRFFQGCERTWSETNLPKIMHCGCSVLALCEAVTLCCIDIPKELLKQGPSLGGSWLSLLLICHNMSHA